MARTWTVSLTEKGEIQATATDPERGIDTDIRSSAERRSKSEAVNHLLAFMGEHYGEAETADVQAQFAELLDEERA